MATNKREFSRTDFTTLNPKPIETIAAVCA
jgi:hypothetical protein